MAWQDEMDILLRAMVNDLDQVVYTDDRLEQILVVAASQVAIEMQFLQDYVADVVNITITPDPSDAQTRDVSFMNMTCLKAASILDQGVAYTAAASTIKVRDGSSTISLEGIFKGQLALLKEGWSSVYDRAKLDYMSGQTQLAGAAVMTPFRLFPWGGGFLEFAPGRDRDCFY
jgi:hypothetical protein